MWVMFWSPDGHMKQRRFILWLTKQAFMTILAVLLFTLSAFFRSGVEHSNEGP